MSQVSLTLPKCGAEIQRKNVAKHVDTTCPLSELQCEYSHVGCTHVSTRKKIEDHVKSAAGMAAHLSLMEKAYTALKQSEESHRGELAMRVKSLEQKNTSLQEKHVREMQHISSRNAALEKKVREMQHISSRNTALEKKVCEMQHISSRNAALEKKVCEMQHISSRNAALEKKVREMQHISSRNTALEKKVCEMQHISSRNAALEKKVQNQSAEMCRLDAENQHLKARLYKSSGDVDVAKHTPRYHHSHSSKPSHLGHSASGVLHKAIKPFPKSQVWPKKAKQSDSSKDSAGMRRGLPSVQ